jgi:hypothetical protein
LREDGGFTYTPNKNFSGRDHFTYQVTNGTLTSNVATVTITVKPAAVSQIPLVPPAAIGEEDKTLLLSWRGRAHRE